MNQPTSFQETQKAKPFIESIMYPSRTVMDLVSILLVIRSEGAEPRVEYCTCDLVCF